MSMTPPVIPSSSNHSVPLLPLEANSFDGQVEQRFLYPYVFMTAPVLVSKCFLVLVSKLS